MASAEGKEARLLAGMLACDQAPSTHWQETARRVARTYRDLEGADDPLGIRFTIDLAEDARVRMHFDEARRHLEQAEEQLVALEGSTSGWAPVLRGIALQRIPRTRIRYYQDLGLLDRSEEHIHRFAESYSVHGVIDGKPRPGWLNLLSVARVEQCLNRADYREAIRIAEEVAPLFVEGDSKNERVNLDRRFQLERRATIARAKLAILDPLLRPRARRELAGIIGSARASAAEAFDARYRAVGLALLDGDRAAAEGIAADAGFPGATKLERALDLAMRVESAEHPTDPALCTELAGALDDLHRAWTDVPARISGTGRFYTDKARHAVLVHARGLANRGEVDEALEVVLRWLSLHDLGRSIGCGPVTGERLRDSLGPERDAALVLWPGDRGGLAFLVERGRIYVTTTAGTIELREAALDVGAAMSPFSVESEGWRERWECGSREIRQGVLRGELADRLAALDRLTVLGNEMLFSLPFHGLLVDGEPLGLRTIVRELAAPGHGLGPTDGALDESRVILVTNVPGESWEDPLGLDVRAVELDRGAGSRIRRSWGERLEALEGAAGGHDRILAGAAAGAGLLIFYCHGDEVNDPERPSALLVGGGGDGRLSCGELEDIDVPPIVVLATCRAAIGPERIGAGTASHLGGALVRGGARVVLLAASDLPAWATAQLVAELSSRMARGETIGEALRGARRELHGREGFEHPSALFSLVLLGDDRTRMAPHDGSGGRGALLVVGAVAAAAILLLGLARVAIARGR